MIDAWLKVRAEVLKRLRSGLQEADGPNLWYVDAMDRGDVSEFPAMMSNLEELLGVPEEQALDWYAEIRALEEETAKT